jgi:hypothetical protein
MRLAVAVAGVLSLLAATGPAAAATTGIRQQASPTTVGCATREVLLLMDQSSSLQTTDPDAARVTAAKVLVSSLSQAGGPVHLAVAGFGDDVSPISRFDLPQDETAAQAEIDGFRDRNDDQNTDYVLALEAAARHFSAIDAAQECKTLLWFTDGAYDLDVLVPAIGEYSTLTDIPQIEAGFEVNICGPGLAPSSTLTDPVSEHIRSAGFAVDLVDLKTGGGTGSQVARRAATEQVLARLFDSGDGCSVPGQRVSVVNADDLVGRFFEQAQFAAGRTAIACGVLATGFPAGLTHSVSVRGTTSQTVLSLSMAGGPAVTTDGTLTHTFSDAERSTPGTFRIEARDGATAECFVAIDGTSSLVGEPSVYEKATTTTLSIAVGGPGNDARPELNVGSDFVALDVTIDGRPASATWDAAIGRWRLDLPGPRTGTVTLAVTPHVLAVNGAVLSGFTSGLAVVAAPPAPQVSWVGERTIEGSGRFDRHLRVLPAASTGGTICVTFTPADQAFVSPAGDVVASLSTGAGEHCGPDAQPFDVPATLVVDDEANAGGSATAGYRSSYTPPDGTSPQDLGVGSAALGEIQLTKSPDVARFWLVGLVLAALSAAIAYACLYLFTRRQTRLADPTGYLMVRLPLVDDGRGRLQPEPADPLRMSAMRPVRGTRSRFELGPDVAVVRHTSLNVLAPLVAHASARSGKVLASPSLGQARRGGRTMLIPPRFRELVVVHLPSGPGTAEAVVVVPAGTTPQAVGQTVSRALERLGSAIASNRTDSPPSASSPTRPPAPGTEPAVAPVPVAVVAARPERTPPPPPPRPGR